MKLAIAFGKVGVLVLWAWGILSFLMPTSVPEPGIGQMAFLGLLAVHAGEAFAFAKGLAAKDGGSMGGHVGRLLVFGFLHLLSVRDG